MKRNHPLKYIFISGGVISGIGKGITSASISYLLKSAGYNVVPIKFENYLNLDAGTINPIEHGDPYLCEDGTEADMDIGTYEKFLSQEMGADNFVTIGKIYKTVIDRERRFEYNGEDVEAIPHITNEITDRINAAAKKHNADIMIIELGGTAGEYQNVFYYEASRMLTLQKPNDVIHVHVSYVPTPKHLGEPKTKPTQLSVRTLNSMGIQPNFIVARSEKYLDQRRRDRFALFCNVHGDDIISNPDAESVYEIPLILKKQDFDKKILRKLQLPEKEPDLSRFEALVSSIKEKKEKTVKIAIIGKYFGTGDYQLRDSYAALFDALDHASWQGKVKLETHWVDAEKIEKNGVETIGKPDGIIVPIGWGVRGSEGMIAAANYAREQKIPYLGLCYGMQLAVVAFARNVVGITGANTYENAPECSDPVIHLIPEQQKILEKRAYGGTMRLGGWDALVEKDTLAYELYGTQDTSERHRHRYEFNDDYAKRLTDAGLIISARSKQEGLVEIIELDRSVHPFYMGTQGHPEYKSYPGKPHPIFSGFIMACKKLAHEV
ncbi:MAG: CTP synthase (glutamine hydrolyzing) [Microgenomates group bacterium]